MHIVTPYPIPLTLTAPEVVDGLMNPVLVASKLTSAPLRSDRPSILTLVTFPPVPSNAQLPQPMLPPSNTQPSMVKLVMAASISMADTGGSLLSGSVSATEVDTNVQFLK
ncbi:MAG: hypothetical protein ACXADY_27375 [Candidatus Hodarchaeales archaeon]